MKFEIKIVVALLTLTNLSFACNGNINNKANKSLNALNPETIEYNSYTNQKYFYSVKYPNFLIPQKEADNQDGRKFVSENTEIQFLVYHSDKIDFSTGEDMSLAEAFEMSLEELDFTDYLLFTHHYMIDGENEKGLFRQITIEYSYGLLNLRFSFPEDKKEFIEPIIEQVYNSVNLDDIDYDRNIDTEFIAFLDEFLDDCWWEKNFNTELVNNGENIKKYIAPDMDVRRFLQPERYKLLANRANKFALNSKLDDFKTINPEKDPESKTMFMRIDLNYCELYYNTEVYYEMPVYIPALYDEEQDAVVQVDNKYEGELLAQIYLVDGTETIRALIFVKTQTGWKLAFVDDSICWGFY